MEQQLTATSRSALCSVLGNCELAVRHGVSERRVQIVCATAIRTCLGSGRNFATLNFEGEILLGVVGLFQFLVAL